MKNHSLKYKFRRYSCKVGRVFLKSQILISVLTYAVSVSAADISFALTDTSGSASWAEGKNWEGGVAPGEGDNAKLETVVTATNDDNRDVLTTVELPEEKTAIERGNLSGYEHFVLLGKGASGCQYSFRSLDGFLGTVKLLADNTFQIRAAETQSIGGLEVNGCNTLDVTGGDIQLGKLSGVGKLIKKGKGDLSLTGVTGALGVTLDVAEGNVNIGNGDLAVLGKAAFHIDAMRQDTFSLNGDKIEQVSDVRGSGYPVLTPFHGKARLMNFGAKKIIDFGGYSGDEESKSIYGEPAALQCSEEITNIKTFFVVYRYNKEDGGWASFPVADTRGYIFRGSQDTDIFDDNTPKIFSYQQYGDVWQMWTPHTVLSGDMRRNGESVFYTRTPRGYGRNLEVFSVSVNEHAMQAGAIPNVAFKNLCRNQDRGETGGTQVAELIIFTRKLSGDEQKAVNDYLVAKWMDESGIEPYAIQAIGTRKGASVTVSSGATIHVKALDTTHGAFVKKGGGTIIAKNVIGNGLIVAEEGQVIFGGGTNRSQLREPLPAVGLLAAFDANKAETVTMGEYDGAQGVLGWKSYSVNNKFDFSSLSFNITNNSHLTYTDKLPQKTTDASGRVWIDFGKFTAASGMSQTADESSHMQLTGPSGGDLGKNAFYEVFFVIERNNEGATPAVLSSGAYEYWRWWRSGYKSIVNISDPGTINTAYAQYAINGRVIDAMSSSYPQGPCVVRVSCYAPTYIGALGNDNGFSRGGFKIGEILFYSRPLSDKERTETEAYLMKKWLGVEHADAVGFDNSSSSIAAVGGEAITLPAGSTLSVSKWGNTPEQAPAILSSDAVLMHLDASDYESLELTTGMDGKAQVQRIWDTRGTTRSAAKLTEPGRDCPNLPGLTMNKITNMPMLDLGTLTEGSASALRWFTVEESGNIVQSGIDFKSFVMVYANIEDNYYADTISNNWGNTPYESGDDKSLWSDRAEGYQARGGADFIDGVKVNGATTPYPHGLHVFGHTNGGNGGVWGYGSSGTGLKKGGGDVGGGMYIAEIIYFNRGLSDDEQVKIGNYLAKKWGISSGAGLSSPEIPSITLDGSATFTSKTVISVGTISGKGLIGAPMVSGVRRIEAGIDSDGIANFVKVAGSVAVEDRGTYSFDFDEGFKIVNGFYTLLETDSAEEALKVRDGLAGWQGEIAPVDGKVFRLAVDGNSVGVNVESCRFMVIMR